MWLHEAQAEHGGHEANDQQRGRQDGAGKDPHEKALLLRDHVFVRFAAQLCFLAGLGN